MAQDELNDVAASVPAPDLNGPQATGHGNFMDKYAAEREKRLRAEGDGQYIDLIGSEKFGKFLEDPWIEANTPVNSPVSDGGRCKFFIAGAGFGAIYYAVHLLKAGFSVDDIVIVDPAGGFGGTWYWNRYPGLMCDVESYIYFPFLEDTGYVPARRYASGREILKYCNDLCSKYRLHERAMFQTRVQSMKWDEDAHEWVVQLVKKPKGGQEALLSVKADFVMLAPGLLSNAKLPDVEGIDSFKGHMFHTARWDYKYTGGSPEDPALTGLQGKKVALIGTGATAIQVVPELAKYAAELMVFQRTPASVDVRDNRDTDEEWFYRSVARHSGWQRERNMNFATFVTNSDDKPKENMVDDGWSNFPSFVALVGGPKRVTMENVQEYVMNLHGLDYPRQERIRQRAKDIVKDQNTAEALQAWYPGWCKRPCFHDEYLQSFNLPHVKLVNTEGKSIDRVVEGGIEFGGKIYDADVIIWSTGFRSPAIGSNAGKANIAVFGRNGASMEDMAARGELSSLHGTFFSQFPNFMTPAVMQAGATANYSFTLDTMTSHQVYAISQAIARAGTDKRAVIEPTQEAVAAWERQIMEGSAMFAGVAGCTPGYYNLEGMLDRIFQDPSQQMKLAKLGMWPNGFPDYRRVLEDWRIGGNMEGLEVTAVE